MIAIAWLQIYLIGLRLSFLIWIAGAFLVFFWQVAASLAQKRRQREMAFQEWLDRCAAIGRQYDVHPSDTVIWRNFFAHRESPLEAVKKAAALIA